MPKKIFWLSIYLVLACPLAAQPAGVAVERRIAALPHLTMPFRNPEPVADSLVLAWWAASDYNALRKALRHASPQVRIAAAIGLTYRYKTKFSRDVLSEVGPFLRDTAPVWLKVAHEYGYMAPQQYRCGELFLYLAGGLQGGTSYQSFLRPLALPDATRAALEKRVVEANTPLSCKTYLLLYKEAPPESWYASVRKQTKAGLNAASVCLARYRREKDIPLILAHLPAPSPQYGFPTELLPFLHFRHPEMLRYLAAILSTHVADNQYYKVVAPYKNDTARLLLERVYEGLQDHPKRRDCLSVMQQVIQANYSPLYTPLLTKIMSETRNGYTLSRLPDSLWRDAPAFTWDYLNTMIRAEVERTYGLPFYHVPQALAYLHRNAPPDSLRVFLIRYIRPGIYYSNLMQIVKFALLDYHPDYEAMFFRLLENEKEGPYRFYYAKMLLAYGRPEIPARLRAFFQKHPDLFPGIQDAEVAGSWVSDTIFHLGELRANKGKKQ